jgi:hypothetical protein
VNDPPKWRGLESLINVCSLWAHTYHAASMAWDATDAVMRIILWLQVEITKSLFSTPIFGAYA